MFWDLGGQEELQSLWDKYYAESHGIIYLVDSDDKGRIPQSKLAFGNTNFRIKQANIPLLIKLYFDRQNAWK